MEPTPITSSSQVVDINQQVNNIQITINQNITITPITTTNTTTNAQTPISNDINIHQKRVTLNDPTDPKQYVMTSVLIYIAQYYPRTKTLLNKVVNNLFTTNKSQGQTSTSVSTTSQTLLQNIKLIYTTSNRLSDDVLRQIIYGPSTTFIPPSQLNHMNRNDTSLIYTHNNQSNPLVSIQQLIKAHKQLNLQQVIPIKRLPQILWYTRSRTLSNNLFVNNRYPSKQLRKQLQLGGENWLDATPLAGLFVVLKHLWKLLLEKMQQHQNITQQKQQQSQLLLQTQKIRLLYARYSFLHNKILTNPVKQLSDDVFTHYETYIQQMFNKSITHLTTANNYVQILIQYSYCLLFYYKYKKCEKLMSMCCQLLELQLEYTGKLGRRTKYQSFDCAQLILSLKNRKVVNNDNQSEQLKNELTQMDKLQQQQANKLIFPDAKKLIIEQVNKANTITQSDNIKQSAYDEDTILLQRPKLNQDQQVMNMSTQEKQKIEQEKLKFTITRQKIITVLAMINYTYFSLPHDEMLFQYISTSITTIFDNKHILTFPLQFSSLLLRSFNEFSRVKYVQRAIQQLQTLKNQYDTKQNKNVDLIFSTPYLTRMEFVMKFASKYMDIQMILTGVNLLKKAGMYEQCVDGLIQRDYKQKALQLVNEIIQQKGKTPRLLCMLGDIHHNNPVYYEEAWQLSEKKYGRAMRSLGWVYFNKNEFQKAAQYFTNATQVNYYNPNTWFTLGCCYIRMEMFQKALRSFGQSVRIDQTQGQAWGNIASCYIQLKKMKQAYSTLEQAVKHAQGNWKLWSNLMSVSLSLKQFFRFFDCVQKIVQLNHPQVLTIQILNKISQIMQFKLYEAVEGKIRQRIIYNFKRRIDGLFAFFSQKMGQSPLIWQAKVPYLQVILQYTVQMYKHYRKQHQQHTLDINDVIDGYETQQQTHNTTIAQTSFIKQNIVQAKQNQLNMTMRIGWDENKIECEKVLVVLKEYMVIYKKYNVNKSDVSEFNLFVKGLKDKIEKTLEIKVELVY